MFYDTAFSLLNLPPRPCDVLRYGIASVEDPVEVNPIFLVTLPPLVDPPPSEVWG